jgi:hypothetical protein
MAFTAAYSFVSPDSAAVRFEMKNSEANAQMARIFPPLLLTQEGGEGRGEEAILSSCRSLRLSPHSFLAGREGECVTVLILRIMLND